MTASFRDPAGRVFDFEGRIFRTINDSGFAEYSKVTETGFLDELVKAGKLVSAKVLNETELDSLATSLPEKYKTEIAAAKRVLEHERIPFPSYPYEWPPQMLHKAAELTLDLAEGLAEKDLGLKDATPYNILFKGGNPVFVDWLSFEPRDPKDPTWIPQAQFIRTFILPLLVNKQFGLQMPGVFLSNRDGLEPEQVYEMVTGLNKLRSPFFSMVTLPKILGAKKSKDSSIYEKHLQDNPDKAKFILSRQFKQLRGLLKKVAPESDQTSEWAEYVGPNQHFTQKYLKAKDEFVKSALAEYSPNVVLDIGCNTGYFRNIAASNGASVISLDQDAVSVGNVWRLAASKHLDILPLVVDITRPSPGVGWLNEENPSFLERIYSTPDAVLMLAVIHHMMVTERIPLPEIFSLFASVTKKILIIEFVPRDDPMFKIISRGRDHLFEYLDNDFFQREAERHFRIVKSEALPDSNRWLYLLTKNET